METAPMSYKVTAIEKSEGCRVTIRFDLTLGMAKFIKFEIDGNHL
jgi:hypothetical protein